MLILLEKIEIVKNILKEKNGNYADIMKEELFAYFFENDGSLNFLDDFTSENQIALKIDFLITKMILHEHEDGIHEIIINYL